LEQPTVGEKSFDLSALHWPSLPNFGTPLLFIAPFIIRPVSGLAPGVSAKHRVM
jgi:hypothetical protein